MSPSREPRHAARHRDAVTDGAHKALSIPHVRQVTCKCDARCSHRALVRPLHMRSFPCIRTHTAETDMERNANDNFGNQNSGDSTTGSFASGTGSQTGSQGGSQGSTSSGSYGAGAPNVSGSTGSAGSSDASFSRGTMADSGNLADRAKDIASSAG